METNCHLKREIVGCGQAVDFARAIGSGYVEEGAGHEASLWSDYEIASGGMRVCSEVHFSEGDQHVVSDRTR